MFRVGFTEIGILKRKIEARYHQDSKANGKFTTTFGDIFLLARGSGCLSVVSYGHWLVRFCTFHNNPLLAPLMLLREVNTEAIKFIPAILSWLPLLTWLPLKSVKV